MADIVIPGLVSTIIPVYNRAELIIESVSSVLAQTYRSIEIIIVDDGSTDETVHVVDEFVYKYPDETFLVIHQANKGTGFARETGRLMARGEFIQYLDSDDLLLPRKFELQIKGLKNHPECGVSYGKTRYRYKDGTCESLPWKGSGTKTDTMFPSFLVSRWWDTPTPLYRSNVCKKAGAWSNLRLEEDWEYDCRIASQGIKLHFCDEFIVEVRDHDQNRLCKGVSLDPFRLRERAMAHKMIFSHSQNAEITSDCPEMQHFARELFLLSRQCGAAGLGKESKDLFCLSRIASGKTRGRGWDFVIYKLLAEIVGWSMAGKIACFSDKFRSRK